jgi:hypothetical protein
MPQPITPMVMRFEGAVRPVRAHALRDNSAAAPAARTKSRRFKPFPLLEKLEKSLKIPSNVPRASQYRLKKRLNSRGEACG